MQKIKNKKNLLFDLAGTLVDLPIEPIWEKVNLEGIHNVFSHLNFKGDLKDNLENNLEKLASDFVEQKKKLRKQAKKDLAEYPLQEQIKNFLEEKKIEISKPLAELDKQFILPELEICSLYDAVHETLEKLKSKYTLFIITNNVSRVLAEETLKRFSLEKYFKQIIVSEDSRTRKPQKEFLSPFLNNNYSLEESVVIGDRLGQDILLAQNCGITSIHIQNDHIDNKGLSDTIQADAEVKEFRELEGLLL